MPFTDLGNTLSALRKAKGYLQSDVIRRMEARGFAVSAGTFSRWEHDKAVPQADEFLALCEIYGVGDVLGTFRLSEPCCVDPLTAEGRRKVDEFERILIASGLFSPAACNVLPFPRRQRRVYDENPVSAGTGQLLESPYFTMVEIADDVPDSVDFGVRVSGDSMEPAFTDGQIVWIRQQPVIEDGEIGIFDLNGQSFLKMFRSTKDGIRLVSLNAAKYAPIDVTENDELRVFGKVIC